MEQKRQENSGTPQTDERTQQGQGRTAGSDNPSVDNAGSKPDISKVDQQEGLMNNGETGGSMENERGPEKDSYRDTL
jgi:hypothetical protein